jgi:phosphonate transport system ATP-binding protein
LELCQERGLAAIVNIHDVVLATEFLPRIVGLRAGSVVFDGPALHVDRDVLTRIYGDEDWTAITQRMQATADLAAEHSEQDLNLAAA